MELNCFERCSNKHMNVKEVIDNKLSNFNEIEKVIWYNKNLP